MDKVRDWITREVLSIDPDAKAREAILAMGEGGVRHVLVRDGDGTLLGMVSNRDVVRVVLANSGRVFDIEGCSVRDIMTPSPLQVVGPDADLAEAAELLDQHQISALPVLEDGKLQGILTTSDLLRTFRQGKESPL